MVGASPPTNSGSALVPTALVPTRSAPVDVRHAVNVVYVTDPQTNRGVAPDAYQSFPWKSRSTSLATAPALTASNGAPPLVRKMLLRKWTRPVGCLPSMRTAFEPDDVARRETVLWWISASVIRPKMRIPPVP